MVRRPAPVGVLAAVTAVLCLTGADSMGLMCNIRNIDKADEYRSIKQYHSIDPYRGGFSKESYVLFTSFKLHEVKNGTLRKRQTVDVLKMVMSRLQIETIEEDAFDGYSCLQHLDLRANRISTINSRMFRHIKSLKRLDLCGNMLESLDEGVFHELQDLLLLDLSANKIKTLHRFTFEGLGFLRVLDLGINRIDAVSYRLFAKLEHLTGLLLDNNLLTNVTSLEFSGLRRLTTLDLSFNEITRLNVAFVFYFKNLKRLNLKGNALTPVDYYGLRRFLPNLVEIDLYENNWPCREMWRAEKYLSGSNLKRNEGGKGCLTDTDQKLLGINENIHQTFESISTLTVYILPLLGILTVLYAMCGIQKVFRFFRDFVKGRRRRPVFEPLQVGLELPENPPQQPPENAPETASPN